MVWNLFGGGKKKAKGTTKPKSAAPTSQTAPAAGKNKLPPIPEPHQLAPGVGSAAGDDFQPSNIPEERLDEAFVIAAIEEAKRELGARDQMNRDHARKASQRPPPKTGDPNASKTDLIHAAMTVHRLKQSALNDLNPAQRKQLQSMAEAMLGVQKGGPKK